MIKHKAMKKCNVLLGDVVDKNDIEINKIQNKLTTISDKAVATKKRLEKSLEYWNNTPTKYSISLEEVSLCAA